MNDGQELWDKFVKKHENFKFVFNGHVLGDGTGKRATLGDNGNVVHQILANYQFNAQGGQGDMRVLEFKADGETVVVRTYSPVLDRYNTAADQQFTLNMNSLIVEGPPPIGHAVVGTCIAAGPTDPAAQYRRFSDRSAIVCARRRHRPTQSRRLPGNDCRRATSPTIKAFMLASISQHSRSDFLYPRGIRRRATSKWAATRMVTAICRFPSWRPEALRPAYT